jgi:hypothetical protein
MRLITNVDVIEIPPGEARIHLEKGLLHSYKISIVNPKKYLGDGVYLGRLVRTFQEIIEIASVWSTNIYDNILGFCGGSNERERRM